MSSSMCYVCHNTVNSTTNEDIREKYRDVVGIDLYPESDICYICCYMITKLWNFKAMCHKRILEYPVLVSEKGILSLQNNDIEINAICTYDDCEYLTNSKSCHIRHKEIKEECRNDDDHHITLDEEIEINGNNQAEISDIETYTQLSNNNDDEDNDCDDLNSVDYSKETDLSKENENDDKKGKKKEKKKKDFEKIILSVEEQKTNLEAKRKNKKYIESEFKCYNCALGFLFKDTYQTHMMRHEESNGEYQCTICTVRFASCAVLRAHSAAHSELYKCNTCGVTMGPRSKKGHSAMCPKKEDTGGATCHLCGNVFRDGGGLQQHLKRSHDSRSGRRYACSVCGLVYHNQAAVRTHMIKHIKRKFNCDHCPATFSSPYTLKQHQKRHDPNIIQQQYDCASCGTVYNSKKSLLAHKRNALAHQQSPVPCPICGVTVSSERNLPMHTQRVHAAGRPFACAACPRHYTTRKSLAKHIATAHTARHAYTLCHSCGTQFKGNNKLKRHMKVCRKAKNDTLLNEHENI